MSDFCKDCPDREFCSTAGTYFTCEHVKQIEADAQRRREGQS